jgi:GNAT superfamily N-acetyltransferase
MAGALMSIPETLITTYLEIRDKALVRPAFIQTDAQILRMERPDTAFYRFLYGDVGAEWRWRDRLAYRDDHLQAILERVAVYVLYANGIPAGYIELEQQGADVEIAYFGLRPLFIGKGLGKHLLSYGILRAWEFEGVQRVWLHTCNLDSPHALQNYMARGFTIYNETHEPMPASYQ